MTGKDNLKAYDIDLRPGAINSIQQCLIRAIQGRSRGYGTAFLAQFSERDLLAFSRRLR